MMVTKFDFLHWSMFLNERRGRGERAQASFPNGDWESSLHKIKKSNLAYSYEPHKLRDSFFRIQGKKLKFYLLNLCGLYHLIFVNLF